MEVTPRRYRFRIMLALPVFVACFTLAAGFFPLNVIDHRLAAGSPLKSLLLEMKIAVLVISTVATIVAVAVASYIVQPVQKVVRELDHLVGTTDQSVSQNEIDALARLHDQTRIPLQGFQATLDLLKGFEEFEKIKTDLRRIDALAALGASVTGMAHEVRTPLGYIRSLSELLREDLKKDSKQQEYLSRIIESTDRLSTTMSNILSLAKVQVDTTSLVNPVTLVREAIAYSRAALNPGGLKLEEEYAEGDCSVRGDRDRLIECFTNLFKNACEASESGGTVTVRVRPATPGGVVEFHNHGSVILAAEAEKLFAPFYTTKKQGTGLGLAISKQIVEAHGGTIRVQSDPQRGTTFRVMLPG